MSTFMAMTATSRPVNETDSFGLARVRPVFQRLAKIAPHAIPVVGLGLSLPAGGISSDEIVTALRTADPDIPGGALPDAVDEYERRHGTQAVQSVVADLIAQRPTLITHPLRCLSHVPGRRIITLNFDDAIEAAINAAGLHPETLLIEHAPAFMEGPEYSDVVQVLHLHGHHSAPATIVLSQLSYDQAAEDERLALLMRWAASTHPLFIVGTSYGEREVTLRSNLVWADSTWRAGIQPDHLYIGLDNSISAEARTAAIDAGIDVLDLPRGTRSEYDYVSLALSALRPSGYKQRRDHAVAGQRSAHYLELTLAAPGDAPNPDDYGARWWNASRRMLARPPVTTSDLLEPTRVLLVGAAGAGKTQTLLHTFQHPNDIWLWLPHLRLAEDIGPQWRLESWLREQNVPQTLFETEICTLVFDGYDELSEQEEANFLAFLEAAESQLDVHRVVISTRPRDSTQALEQLGFERYTIVPDTAWLYRYAERRAVDRALIDAFLDRAPGLRELAATACFAAAIVDALFDDADLPDDALGLLLFAQDRVTETDNSTVVPAADRHTILDGLAYAFEGRGVVQCTRSDVEQIVGALGLIPPDLVAGTIRGFVARSLLLDPATDLRFPTPHAQEARAARWLLSSERGLEHLRDMALGDVAGHRTSRPSCRRMLQLCLMQAPDDWHDEVRLYDIRSALRATPSASEPAARLAAVRTMWKWYETKKVWMPVSSGVWGDPLLDDLATIHRLAHGAPTDSEFVDHLFAATADAHPTVRGNALLVLEAVAPSPRVEATALTLLEDPDPTVRRFAARAVKTKFDANVAALSTALHRETEELAQEAAAGALIDLLDPDDASELLDILAEHGTPPTRIVRLATRWISVDAQLEWLTARNESQGDVGFWARELADNHTDALTDTQFTALLRLLTDEDLTHPGTAMRELAVHHLGSTLRTAKATNDPYKQHLVLGLLAGVPHDDLAAAAATVNASELLPQLPRGSVSPRPTAAVAPTADLATLVESGDVAAILTLAPDVQLIAELSEPVRAELQDLIAAAVADRPDAGSLPRQFSWSNSDERQLSGPHELLRWAAATDQPVPTDEWFELIQRTFTSADPERHWLRQRINAEILAAAPIRLTAFPEAALVRFVHILRPEDWTHDLARSVVERARSITMTREGLQLEIIKAVERVNDATLIEALAASGFDQQLCDEALVRIGDPKAERRCLAEASADITYAFRDVYDADPWLSRVRHHESATALAELVL